MILQAYRVAGVLVLALLMALILAACETAPKSPRQYFAATYQLIGATSDSIVALAQSKQITPAQGLEHHAELVEAKKLTDEARKILQCRDAIKAAEDADTKCGTTVMAESSAAMARGMINQIQLILEAKK